jgi:hypothetical protein
MNDHNDEKLNEIGSTIGINLFQLKEKYKSIIEKNENMTNESPIATSTYTQALSTKDLSQSFSTEFSSKPVVINQTNQAIISDKQKESIDAQKALDNYKICNKCLGKGYTTYIYNHRVMQETCEECDGDSVVMIKANKEILQANAANTLEEVA